MHSFNNEQDAARCLLGLTCLLLTESKIKYCVVGGWIPFLRVVENHWPYPGTFDVDILLDHNTTQSDFDHFLSTMKNHEFFLAAKNKFQIHKLLMVNGEKVAFHVDFLHAKYAPDQEEGIFLNWNKMMSIAGPGSDLVFVDNLFTVEKFDYVDEDGNERSGKIILGDCVALICMKGRSLHVVKREKDSYDIFLCFKYLFEKEAMEVCSSLFKRSNIFKESINGIDRFFSLESEPNGASNVVKKASKSSTAELPFLLSEEEVKRVVLNATQFIINDKIITREI